MRPATIPPEKPPRMMALDGLAKYVCSIEAGARALRREASLARASFRVTDMEHHAHDAKALEELALRLDVRRRA